MHRSAPSCRGESGGRRVPMLSFASSLASVSSLVAAMSSASLREASVSTLPRSLPVSQRSERAGSPGRTDDGLLGDVSGGVGGGQSGRVEVHPPIVWFITDILFKFPLCDIYLSSRSIRNTSCSSSVSGLKSGAQLPSVPRIAVGVVAGRSCLQGWSESGAACLGSGWIPTHKSPIITHHPS